MVAPTTFKQPPLPMLAVICAPHSTIAIQRANLQTALTKAMFRAQRETRLANEVSDADERRLPSGKWSNFFGGSSVASNIMFGTLEPEVTQ